MTTSTTVNPSTSSARPPVSYAVPTGNNATRTPNQTAPNHYRQIDALRFFAAMSILVMHYLPLEVYASSLLLTRIGIRFFFLTSGYMAVRVLMKQFGRADTAGVPRRVVLARYYLRRFCRLYP